MRRAIEPARSDRAAAMLNTTNRFVSAVGVNEDNGWRGRGADFARGGTKDDQMRRRRAATAVNCPPMNAARTPQMNPYSFRRSIKSAARVTLGLIDSESAGYRVGPTAAAKSRRDKGLGPLHITGNSGRRMYNFYCSHYIYIKS